MKIRNLLANTAKHKVLLKFLALLALFIAYFIYLSMKFDMATGVMVAMLTWSFFVLATPIADAGFLLDFPLRLILGVRMFISEIFVWVVAILINFFALIFSPQDYDKTFLTGLLKKIIITPYPYWIIIILSGIGTFLSIRLGDDFLDAVSHKEGESQCKKGFKKKMIIFISVLILVVVGYYYLLESLGISI